MANKTFKSETPKTNCKGKMMVRAKKPVVLLLLIMLMINLISCGTNSNSPGEDQKDSSQTVETGGNMLAAAEGGDIEEILKSMTLREKVEQMLIVSYRIWEEPTEEDSDGDSSAVNQTAENTESEDASVNVTEINDGIRASLAEHHFGGTLLFAENYVDAEQTIRLVSDLQSANREAGGLPLIVATDQEGGNVSRITFGTAGVGNMALAATGDPENAKAMAKIYGDELSLLGVNTDFAPVMDVNNNPNNPVIGVRSFSDSPEVVAEYGLSYIAGLHNAGTIATLKHFPGHGNTDTDSHTGFPLIESTYDELKEFELVPFQQAIDAGADMIMTAHIQYPNIENETYTSISTGEDVYLPATMSHTIMTDILRNDMGFQGVIVTDALDMAAISDNFEIHDIMKLTINAGVDMLILPIITDKEIFQRVEDMTEAAVKLAEDGEIDTEMIDDSVRRILTLKKQYGLLDITNFDVTDDQIEAAVSAIGSDEHREAAWSISKQALTLLENKDSAFPINVDNGQNVLIIFGDCCASRVATAELAESVLRENAVIPGDVNITVMVNDSENESECLEEAKNADHVILTYRTYDSACLNPETEDGLSSAVFDKIIEERHNDNKKVIIVTCQLPYDGARFMDADAILLAYNSSIMREVPAESGEGSAYMPNLAVALCACLGYGDAVGKLPVNIYELNDKYEITDKVLYERDVQ